MLLLKQSTASQSVKLGPFVDSTDGDTAETGLTIANTDIKLSKNGGTMAAKNSGGGTHDADGWYTITLDATDTDTAGRLQVSCKVAGALRVFMEFQVIEETVYDSLFAASATGYQVPIWASASATVNLSATTVKTVTDGVALAATATSAQLVDDIWDEVITGAFHNVNGSAGKFVREGAESVGLTGTAQAGAATTITLASGAVTATDIFKGEQVSIIEGTGAGQARTITAATTGTDVCTVHRAWTTNPDSTSVYSIRGADADLIMIRDTVVAECTAVDFDDIGTILADTNELQTDWANGGRLDLILDARASQTSVDDVPTVAEFEARTLVAANYATAAALTTVDNEIAVIDGIVDDLKSGIIYGAAATGTLSTTQATTDLTGYADDQLIGRHITWLSGNCEGEQTDITDYSNTNGLLTFTLLTTAPANGDTFKIT